MDSETPSDVLSPTAAYQTGSDPDLPGVVEAPAVPGYQCLSVLGRGGMGVIYKAVHLKLKRPVALKMILAGPHAGPRELERFRSEAEAAARLQHPNIVQIFVVGELDVGAGSSRPYMARALVAGGSLAERLRGAPLPAREAAELVETLARAMHYAHERGVIHRDLKPANILLAGNRQQAAGNKDEKIGASSDACCLVPVACPKITDFGLAKQLDADSGATQTGQVLGTPSYMAPEQATGSKDIGPLADVYALGAILYECLTGRPPFKAATVLDTLEQVRTQEPVTPRQLQPTTPRDLETICLKCLQKEPTKRYTSAEALADDLQRFLDGRPIQARPVSRIERTMRWCRRNPVGALLIVSLSIGIGAALALTVWALDEKDRADGEAVTAKKKTKDAEDNAAESRERLCRFCVSNGVRLSDEGDLFGALLWLAEPLVRDPGNRDQEVMARARLAAYRRYLPNSKLLQLLSHDGPVRHLAFSPDGRWVVTASNDCTARVWEAATGQPVSPPLKHQGFVMHTAFSADGRWLVTASGVNTARVWEAATGQPVSPPLKHQNLVTHATFSPNGEWVVTASNDRTARVWEAATGRPVSPPLQHQGQVKHAAFSPDGRWVLTASQDSTARVWEPATGQPVNPPLKHQGEVAYAAFSPDGRWVVTASHDRTAQVWETATGQPVNPPLKHQDLVTHAAFSPNGEWVVTASHDRTARVWEAATGQPVSPPLQHQDLVRRATFSPDGRWVLTTSFDHTARVWAAATGQPVGPPLKHQDQVTHAAFSPDGRCVVTAIFDSTALVW